MKKFLFTTIACMGLFFLTLVAQAQAPTPSSGAPSQTLNYPVKSLTITLKGSAGSSPNISLLADNTKFFRDSVTADFKITGVSGKVYSSISRVKMNMVGAPIPISLPVATLINDFNGSTLDVTFNFPANASG